MGYVCVWGMMCYVHHTLLLPPPLLSLYAQRWKTKRVECPVGEIYRLRHTHCNNTTLTAPLRQQRHQKTMTRPGADKFRSIMQSNQEKWLVGDPSKAAPPPPTDPSQHRQSQTKTSVYFSLSAKKVCVWVCVPDTSRAHFFRFSTFFWTWWCKWRWREKNI